MNKIGFFIHHGVEVRYFLLSGLLNFYKEKNEVCLYVTEDHSEVLKDYANKYNVEIKTLPSIDLKTPKFEGYLKAFTNARKRASKNPIYSHLGQISTNKPFDIIFKIKFVFKLFEYFFKNQTTSYYKNIEYITFFKTEGLTKIYLLEYNSGFLRTIGVNAGLAGIETNVFINNLKTLHIQDFISFKIKKLFSWNLAQNELFQNANLLTKKSKFEPKGSPYHTFLREVDIGYQEEVIKKYNLNVLKPIVLYSLINEKVYKNEHLIIEQISNYIEENFEEKERPQIIVRRNPFEVNSSHVEYISKLKNITIADHFWERKENKEWSIQTEEGEVEWRALLQLATVSMNIPSMATIDSLMCGTPVVNIKFNHQGVFNSELSFIIESPYSKYFEDVEFVFSINSINELNNLKEGYLFAKSKNNNILQSLDISKSTLEKFL